MKSVKYEFSQDRIGCEPFMAWNTVAGAFVVMAEYAVDFSDANRFPEIMHELGYNLISKDRLCKWYAEAGCSPQGCYEIIIEAVLDRLVFRLVI